MTIRGDDPRHAPHPDRVARSRRLKDDGQRLPEGRDVVRPYYCRSCGLEQTSALIPRGWYTVARATGTHLERPLRLGIYCSIRCLEAQLPRLKGIEDDHDGGMPDNRWAYQQQPGPATWGGAR